MLANVTSDMLYVLKGNVSDLKEDHNARIEQNGADITLLQLAVGNLEDADNELRIDLNTTQRELEDTDTDIIELQDADTTTNRRSFFGGEGS